MDFISSFNTAQIFSKHIFHFHFLQNNFLFGFFERENSRETWRVVLTFDWETFAPSRPLFTFPKARLFIDLIRWLFLTVNIIWRWSVNVGIPEAQNPRGFPAKEAITAQMVPGNKKQKKNYEGNKTSAL